MKRGNFLLLVFALSLFSISVFSFLPMVSGEDIPGEYCDEFLLPDTCNYARMISACVGDDVHAVRCFWYDDNYDDDKEGKCMPDTWFMDGCKGKEDMASCYESSVTVAGIPLEGVERFSGKCLISQDDEGYHIGVCSKGRERCRAGYRCEIFDNGKGACTLKPVPQVIAGEGPEETSEEDSGIAIAGGETDEETTEETTEALAQVLASKPLIFKTILAILLIALVLAVIIYFKPKNKHKKRKK